MRPALLVLSLAALLVVGCGLVELHPWQQCRGFSDSECEAVVHAGAKWWHGVLGGEIFRVLIIESACPDDGFCPPAVSHTALVTFIGEPGGQPTVARICVDSTICGNAPPELIE